MGMDGSIDFLPFPTSIRLPGGVDAQAPGLPILLGWALGPRGHLFHVFVAAYDLNRRLSAAGHEG